MKRINPNIGWTATARLIHWLMAVLILTQYAAGWIADEMDRSPMRADLMTTHKSVGITLLLLLVLRIFWRWRHPVPGMPADSKPWELTLSRWGHRLLYLLMVLVPLSGWLAASTAKIPWQFFWTFPWPRIAQPDRELHHLAENAHALLFWSLLIILLAHVLAALRHHFIKKNDVLSKMLGGRQP